MYIFCVITACSERQELLTKVKSSEAIAPEALLMVSRLGTVVCVCARTVSHICNSSLAV